MYKLPYFTEQNDKVVFDFMRKNSFAILTGYDGNFPVATHVPLDVQREGEKIVCTGHMMRNTDHHRAFSQNENVLAIFTGPHCYVSASWYVTKNVASTWNYMDVHAKGKIQFTDEEQTKRIIKSITDTYELAQSEASFDKLPKEYVDRLVKAIVGFTIEISGVENVFKLSQNHIPETKERIISNLEMRPDEASHAIAAEMKKRIDS